MIQKVDLVLVLNELKNTNAEAETLLKSLYKTPEIPLDTIKFINQNRPFDVAQFYEKLRKSYNEKKSSLYKNIVNENLEIEEVPITLSSYLLQALLYSKKVENRDLFLKNSRVEEVTTALHNYFSDYDIDACKRELELIKADIKLFEYLK